LRGANLTEAKLIGANLEKAILTGASLKEAKMVGASLSGAQLCGTILEGSNLCGVFFGAANFEGAIVGYTIFGDVDLSSCTGLDSANHVGPSTMGIDSIIDSKGKIPEIFLRGVGLPDEWITQISLLLWDGIQFFSCFISYSNADKPFAVRLHDALQSKGIRCWLDEKQTLTRS
jgi:uncharacterized protein YjbI with pentapeptide repeats